MSSIPLPALSVKPQEGNDILGSVGKYVQLKSLLQGQQVQKQQLQADQLKNQQSQINLQSQQALMKAFNESGGDLSKAVPLAAQYGATPKDTISLQQAAYQQRMNALNEIKTKGEFALQMNDIRQGAYDKVAAAPPADRPAVYQQIIGQLRNIDPDAAKLPPEYPGDQVFATIGTALQAHSAILKDEAAKAGIGKDTAQAAAANADAAIKQNELKATQGGGAAPGIPLEIQEANDWLAKNKGKTLADYQVYKSKLNPQAQIMVQGGAPSDALVQAVANGSMKISDVLTYRTPLPVRKQFLNEVLQVNPNFNSANYDIEKGVTRDFTSGKSAQSLTAFNTAIEHAKQLSQATDALNNGDVVQLNKLGNALGYQFGSDKTTNFNVIKNALSGEISKVFKGGGATDAEIEAVQGPFSASNSPAQLKGAINNAISLMNSKRDALKQQYAAGTQAKPNFGEGGGKDLGPAPAGKAEGSTGTLPDGTKVVVRGGRILAQ